MSYSQAVFEADARMDRVDAHPLDKLVEELRQRVIVGGDIGHIYGAELETLIRAIQAPKPGFEPPNGGAWSRRA